MLDSHVGGRGAADLIYNKTSGYWACCWDSSTEEIDCENPSNEIYPAPAPVELKTIQFLPRTESGTPVYATATATATGTARPANSSSNGVSAGVAAGIGVGVAAGVILIATIALFFFFRKRAANRVLPPQEQIPIPPQPVADPQFYKPPNHEPMSEQAYELDKNEAPTPELHATSRSQ